MASDAPANGQKIYLLIDHAGAPGLLAELRGRSTVDWWNLFDGSTEQGALDVAPILVCLRDGGANAAERALLAWLHRVCEFSASFTAMQSTMESASLIDALKRRLDVVLPDQMPVLLRYFDTRILESLLGVLTDEQRIQFLGIASSWQWLDRAGRLQWQDAAQCQVDPWPDQFEFDVRQQNMLIEASEADVLAQQMQSQAPDLCRPKARAELHALANLCLPRLRELALDELRTRTLYCLTALQLGPVFDQQPAWSEALGRVAKKQVSFEAVLNELGV